MADDPGVKPLKEIVEACLAFHSKISLRSKLFGPDPDLTPKFILDHQGRYFSRDMLVDVYAIFWPLFDCALLWLVVGPLHCSLVWTVGIGTIAAYRLFDLMGAILWVLIKRSPYDSADERKMAISLLAYVEPIFLFAILHGALSAILAINSNSIAGAGYALDGKAWNWVSVLHYSVGCYTTIGSGSVSALCPFSILLSDIETLTGIIMITLTITVFVSRALSAKPTPERG